MSRREGVLCDATDPWNDKTCPVSAIGKCVLCEKDVCRAHAAHPVSALRIEVSRADAISGADDQQRKIEASSFFDMIICRTCAIHVHKNVLDSAISGAMKEALLTSIKARLARAALEK